MNIHLIILCLFPLFNSHLVFSDQPPYEYCPDADNNITTNRIFQKNVKSLLDSLPSKASQSKSYDISEGNANHTAYGLYFCLRYVTLEDCEKCIIMATQVITTLCPNSTDATVWQEVCQLRVSNKRFIGHLDDTGNIPKYNSQTVPEAEKFRSVVNASLFNLTHQAVLSPSDMYANQSVPYSGTDKIYSFVQCSPDISPTECYQCLQNAIIDVLGSNNYKYEGGRLLSKSCYLRYETYDFLDNETAEDTADQTNNQGKKWVMLVVEIGLACTLSLLLGSCVLYYAMKKKTVAFRARENPFFDLDSIYAATDNFAEKNVLGEGGFGPVFKGTLKDGTEVAVKRLSDTSDQGTEEFTNEVLLIMKLQHKNLVRLLGFCVEGAERLLVYELLSHGGLDSLLYDPQKRDQLDWTKRLNIINGIARGILYLHEDSRLIIIHRDLKPSNVLLDSNLHPKISDFGNARIYGGNRSEASTATVIGTYGYMAPEYAMEGIYSMKSDVYSFGIILLEVITGRKNLGFHLSGKGPSLQAYAWQMWTQGRGVELMDPLLTSSGSCNVNEFLRCLHIGLLCVQEDASERPIMSVIVHMLTSENVNLYPPKHPAFSVGRFGDHYEASPGLKTSLRCFPLSDFS